ncbi:MAG: hypothetical protein PW788_12855 [Micavibrio sp.]|nr:hypothetical protein [Micavibrio sp.]
MAQPTSRSFYAGVFIISGLLMALQVLQARIFSVTTWYHLSFLVISIAMFGLTLGALYAHKEDEATQRQNYGTLMTEASARFGLFILLALIAQLRLPLAFAEALKTAIFLPLIAACTIPAYFYAGYVLSLAMTRAPFPSARTYGFDLLGAAAGCLLTLAVMEAIDAPSAVLLVSAAALLAARCFGPYEKKACGHLCPDRRCGGCS